MVLVHYRSQVLFSLGEWSPQIQTRFHVPDPTQERADTELNYLKIRGFHPLWHAFHRISLDNKKQYSDYEPPRMLALQHHRSKSSLQILWFGLFPVRSSLLRESQLISFPLLLRYFSSQSVLRNRGTNNYY